MFKTILLAYDGSDHARNALSAAAALTQAFDAKLHLVTTPQPDMPPIVLSPYGEVPGVVPTDAQVAEAGDALIQQARDFLDAKGVTLADSHILRGDPVGNILSIADATDADLVVMGRRGLGTFKSLALGSVSQDVTHRLKIPCMTVT